MEAFPTTCLAEPMSTGNGHDTFENEFLHTDKLKPLVDPPLQAFLGIFV